MLASAIDQSRAILMAVDGLVFIIAFLFGTYVWWRALAILKWEKFVFDPFGHQTRVLRFLLALCGGFVLAVVAVIYVLAGQALRILL
ncbi:MAG: DUF1146 family protein [Alicyclobacillus macrosporangiidus]|uniref:DUF1146 family protein n=1 Tax=Alicyclobacillus macrosporangiidus TaxID=392015 RepID=UPI0026F25967|nr:DUF1146 family protein [Alicyclobacillus macrosporangiidus]MCL6599363.1 DUF1146 family protein [Alicyclobacillus macrosporangiidus]